MNIVEALQETVLEALLNIFGSALLWIPNLLGALVVFLFGLLFAKVARDVIGIILTKIQLDRWLNRFHVSDVLKDAGLSASLSEIVAFVAYWVVLLAFINSAVGLLGVVFITRFLNSILNSVPEVVAALLVFIVGVVVANYASRAIKKMTDVKLVPNIFKGAIIFFAVLVAVDQLGINIDFLTRTVSNIVTAAVFALAIAFGFGGKDKAKEIIEKYIK